MESIANAAEVAQVLDCAVRPLLKQHGGAIEVTGISGGTVYVRLRGACATCASAQSTLSELVEAALKAALPWVRRVENDVWEPELLRLAKAILRHEPSSGFEEDTD